MVREIASPKSKISTMIWFQCKQCGKTHGRAEDLSGTLVFCECGQGNRVPWSSTASEPAAPPPVSTPPAPPQRRWKAEDEPVAPRRWRPGQARPNFDPRVCLNHPELPRDATCTACREAFCSRCVVTLEGRTLCAPCKDFRARSARQPPRISALAIVSCLIGVIVAGPVSFCLPLVAVSGQSEGAFTLGPIIVIGVISLTLPAIGLILGLLALRNIETKPNLSGRPVALIGTISAAIGVLWCVVVFIALAMKQGGS
jgi:hypothetical protein